MQMNDEQIQILNTFASHKTHPMSSHPLLAPTSLQQLAISLHIPLLVYAIVLKRRIECGTVAIPFGIGEDSVAIE